MKLKRSHSSPDVHIVKLCNSWQPHNAITQNTTGNLHVGASPTEVRLCSNITHEKLQHSLTQVQAYCLPSMHWPCSCWQTMVQNDVLEGFLHASNALTVSCRPHNLLNMLEAFCIEQSKANFAACVTPCIAKHNSKSKQRRQRGDGEIHYMFLSGSMLAGAETVARGNNSDVLQHFVTCHMAAPNRFREIFFPENHHQVSRLRSCLACAVRRCHWHPYRLAASALVAVAHHCSS